MRQFSLLIVLFSFILSNAQTQYKSFHFTTDDGLPSNIIYCITEDNNKNLLIGTDNGFSVFNGNDFINYNVKEGLNNPYIVSVYNDNGTIFLLNYTGKLQKFQKNKIISTSIFSEYQNQIITTKDKIFLFNSQNRHLNKTYPFIIIDKDNFNITKQVSQTLFKRIAAPILLQNGEEIKINNDFLEFQSYKIKLPKEIKFIHKVIFRKNDVCVLEDDYLYILNFQGNINSKIQLPSNLSKNPIYKHDFVIDKLENCWLSIQNQGLFILKKNNWVSLSQSIGLNNQDNVNFLYCDSLGKIWIATNEKGLFCIPSTLNETISIKNTDNYFNGFATSLNKNSLFFSTRFKLYSYDKNATIKNLENSKTEIILNNFEGNPVLNSLKTQTQFWNKKLNLLNIKGKQIIEKIDHQNYVSLIGNNAICLSTLSKNKITEKIIVNKITKKEKIKSILKYKNEYYFNNGQEINIRTFDKDFIYNKRILKFKIKGFIEDFNFINDTMWIAANNAIYKVLNEKIVDIITAINTIKLDNIRKIKPINNDVFLCAGNGLFKISTNGNCVLNKFNYLPTNDVYNVAVFDNNLFVATNNGLAKIDQKIINLKSKKPSFEILYSDKITPKIELEAEQQFTSIKLNIQNFYAIENQIIQYKVDNSNWLQTKNKGINFQSVSYGNHKISIRIKDINSDWKVKEFEICRAYPFYLKWWFFLLLFLFLGFILIWLYRNQIKKITQKRSQEIATNNQIIELRQNALSAMMNPHFIFNSLSAGQYFINSNQQEKSSEHIGKLARLVRLFLSQSSQSFISVADEIKRLQLYVELEQVRFNDFKFVLKVDEKIDVLETKIPNMIVQPFIENAILHGISNPKITDGKIELKFGLNNDILTIEIIDNGFGIEENKTKNNNHISKGIAIIEERMSIMQKSNPTKVFSITQDFAFSNLERKGHKVVIETTILD